VTVRLRRFGAADGALLQEGALDAYVAKIEHLDRGDALASRIDDAWAWVVEVDGEPIGAIGARSRHIPGLADLGYWIVERARGHGYAAEAADRAAALLFAEGVARLQAVVELWNTASRRTLEKARFRREGLLRGYVAWPDEPRHDVYVYARLDGD
jgi:RimJ/RimL family protein N-acetyltransferase